MSFLQLLWYAVIGLLFAVFLVLDGADLGIGMATRFLAFNYDERQQLLRTIGPHWDGNEVFLITAGGSMFASMPMWYASLFSGFYLLLFLVLIALIFRGVSFEFAENAETKRGRNAWMWTNFCGSFFTAFLLGMLFTAMIQAVPMDAHGDIFASFGDVVNPLSLLGGVALTALCLYQGLHYATLRTSGLMRYHAATLCGNLYWAAYPVEVLFALALYLQTDFFVTHPVATILFLVIIVLSTLVGHLATLRDYEWTAYLASTITLSSVVALIFVGLFPNVLIARNPAHTLTIVNASATPYTLGVMTIVLCVLLPIVIAYFTWSYVSQWHRVSLQEVQEEEAGY
ncbi:cytochrome d ubiquinol oxidase subunit II [Fructilactobacillus myrtifloralis]|uniref:Cytochrome d ubiquinol oxidase subunit II n=1 Tax=Fructilactobacillus myrtifloralis TaxID=2940301 RepID=A0ABY5BQ35_9LACO|nr:cytochrome d ubiquinol oxidase subunit II [Fructilactobacillus myrtifloralis]USS84519.1 cytochrome d ubiquinol oxidase subunit II [Fructilactobacillus myrtifloralis]